MASERSDTAAAVGNNGAGRKTEERESGRELAAPKQFAYRTKALTGRGQAAAVEDEFA
jgi:hypothetical protein